MKQTRNIAEVKTAANRNYKSTIFAMLFGKKERLLKLYNAISGRKYMDPEALEINTLENAIYLGMKNDLSFLIDDQLSLYEHQSTVNPNLPLRFLFYISDLYSGMTKKKNLNLYGEKPLSIPAPCFVIFYNGAAPQPDYQILKLSELYTVKNKEIQLELAAVMLNVNRNHNKDLMEACQDLKDYAEYVDRVRRYTKEMNLEEAVELAITECIREGILKGFLEENRAEVKSVSIYEYDREEHIRMEKQASWEEGVQEGIKEGMKEGILRGEETQLRRMIEKKLSKGKNISQIAEELEEEEDRVREIIKDYALQ